MPVGEERAELIECFHQFADQALRFLKSQLADAALERAHKARIVFTSDDEYEMVGSETFRLGPLWNLLDHEDLLGAEVVDQCLVAFRQAGLVGPPDPTTEITADQRRSFVHDLLGPLLEVIGTAGTLDVPRDAVERAIIAYIEYECTDHEWTFLIPLLNVDTESDPLSIGRFRIEKLTLAEKSDLWSPEPMIGQMLEFRHVYRTKRKLIYTASHRGHPRQKIFTVANEVNHLHDEAQDVLTALRLVGTGEVGGSLYIHRIGGYSMAGSMNEYRTSDNLAPPAFHLRAADEASLTAIHDHLRSLRARGAMGEISVALRRFNLSYSRTTLEDELIDYTIALEATILHGLTDELKYRLGLRAAALLRASEPPRRIHGFLQNLYDVRSLVVHEGKRLVDAVKKKRIRLEPNVDPLIASAFMDEAERLVRKILVAYLEALSASPDATLSCVNKSLDSMLLTKLPVPDEGAARPQP